MREACTNGSSLNIEGNKNRAVFEAKDKQRKTSEGLGSCDVLGIALMLQFGEKCFLLQGTAAAQKLQ